jgi:hypothetical protein
MKSTINLPPEYFLRYKEKPVKIKKYSVAQGRIGEMYSEKISNILIDYKAQVMVRGSTAYKISGKGDVEIGVYPGIGEWGRVIDKLKEHFGEPENVEKNYIRFNFLHKKSELEIIVMKGREAYTDIILHKYLMTHPKLLKKYEKVKTKYSYSKREYNFRKNEFLREVEKRIPED